MTPIQQLEDLANDVEICGLDCEWDNTERRRYFSIVYRIRKALKEMSTDASLSSTEGGGS